MTVAEVRTSDAVWLTPEQIAPILRCNAHAIRLAAKEYPELLGFPVIRLGNRTKIPRKAFLQFLGEEIPDNDRAEIQ